MLMYKDPEQMSLDNFHSKTGGSGCCLIIDGLCHSYCIEMLLACCL